MRANKSVVSFCSIFSVHQDDLQRQGSGLEPALVLSVREDDYLSVRSFGLHKQSAAICPELLTVPLPFVNYAIF